MAERIRNTRTFRVEVILWKFCRDKSLPQITVADLHSKILDARPPGGPNSFNFMQFLGKFGKIVCWRPPEVGAPSSGKS